MKVLMMLALVCLSTNVFSETKTSKKIVPAKVVEVKQGQQKPVVAEAPCADSKEDVLKKLEEKKKAQAQVNKGFSLQGGNDTGCSIK